MQTQNLVWGFGSSSTGRVKIAAYNALEAAAVDVGRTMGGLELQFDREIKDVMTDQDPGPIAAKEVKRVGKLKMKLANVTPANLAYALGLPTTALAGSVLSLGAPAQGEQYWTLYINVDGPAGGSRKYVLNKVVIIGNSAHFYKRDAETVVELDFEVLFDTSKSAGQEYGTITDTSSDTTAPTVVLTTPADGGTVVKNTAGTVLWTITDAGVMDESTIVYGDTFQIINTTTPASASLVAGTIAYDASAKTVTFTPTSNWTASDTFQAIVSKGLKDAAGNRLATPKIEQFSVTA